MLTKLTCKNCSAENPFYQLTCISCSAYLREKVFNIDLWNVLITLIESPSKAYARIIHSEHKNFVFLILFLASIKLSINSIYLSLSLLGERHLPQNFFVLLFITIIYLSLSVIISSLLYKSFVKNKTRFMDNFSIIIYSLFPHAFALILLLPIELILFGYTIFSVNPSAFIIKETLAYTMLGFETIFILWALFLSFMAFKRQAGDVSTAVIFTFIFNLLVYGSLFITARVYFLL
jgi:hypothetical protein